MRKFGILAKTVAKLTGIDLRRDVPATSMFEVREGVLEEAKHRVAGSLLKLATSYDTCLLKTKGVDIWANNREVVPEICSGCTDKSTGCIVEDAGHLLEFMRSVESYPPPEGTSEWIEKYQKAALTRQSKDCASDGASLLGDVLTKSGSFYFAASKMSFAFLYLLHLAEDCSEDSQERKLFDCLKDNISELVERLDSEFAKEKEIDDGKVHKE